MTVEAAADLLENDPTFHTDVDRGLFEKLPLESQSSSVSSLVTLATPRIADSNGLFHGMGDHAENSFSVDGQPITDQQSKVFSNQIPLDSIQSMEVISGAPPAEFGEKASVVINVTTRSGQGVTTPHGSVNASYGSFGTANAGFDLAYGGEKSGNFISVDGLNSGRFLDPPEFTIMHARGNEQNIFDRVDFQLSPADSIHLNFGFTRSWFQTPNSFDAENATAWNGLVVDNGGIGPNGIPQAGKDVLILIPVRLALACGQMEPTLRWAATCGLRYDDPLTTPLARQHYARYVTLARVLIARGRGHRNASSLAQARTLLDRLLEIVVAAGAQGRHIEVQMLLALTLYAQGKTKQALSTLGSILLWPNQKAICASLPTRVRQWHTCSR